MSEQPGETAQVVDANTATDEEVSAALGLGDANTDTEGQEPEESNTSEEFTELPEFWQKEVNRLRRENAAARVKARQAKPKSQEDEGTDVATAVKRARDEARSEARLEYGAKLAAAEVKATLTGIVPDSSLDDIVDDLNMSRYVDDDGEIDRESVAALRDKYKALFEGKRKQAPKPNTAASSGKGPKTAQDEFAEFISSI